MNPEVQTQSKLSNPPTEQTKMVSPKLSKVRALQAIWSAYHNKMINPGQEVELPEDEVAEYCDRRFRGPYNFDGFRSKKTAERALNRRAIRMSDVAEIERRNKEIEKVKAGLSDKSEGFLDADEGPISS